MIFGFADDLAVAVSTKHLEDVEVYAMETVRAVKSWLERVEFTLMNEKVGGHVVNPKLFQECF